MEYHMNIVELSFESGGNYIMLVYNDFSVTIQLTVSER